MKAIFIGVVAMCMLVACAKPLDCLIDKDCVPTEYCASTQCVSSTPNPDTRTAYLEQIRPVINQGCSCHQAIHQRPWSFSAESREASVIEDDLSQLALWGYDPLSEQDFPAKRPTLSGFGLSECGFNHPGVFANRVTPHNTLLQKFLTESPDLAAPGGDEAESTPLEFEVGLQLPELERIVLDLVRVDEPTAFRTEILPRIIGQCGCCHRDEGQRGWRLPTQLPSDAEGLTVAREQVLSMWIRANPEVSSFVTYGLGRGGGATLHPKVYTDETDPRLRLLIGWVALLPPDTAEPEPDTDTDEPDPASTE